MMFDFEIEFPLDRDVAQVWSCARAEMFRVLDRSILGFPPRCLMVRGFELRQESDRFSGRLTLSVEDIFGNAHLVVVGRSWTPPFLDRPRCAESYETTTLPFLRLDEQTMTARIVEDA